MRATGRARSRDYLLVISLSRRLFLATPSLCLRRLLGTCDEPSIFPRNLSRTKGRSRRPRRTRPWKREREISRHSHSRALDIRPSSTDRGSEGHRVANCTDTRRFSVSRRSFQRATPLLPLEREPYPPPTPRGPWLLAQALVLFRGLRPILIHVVVSTVLSSTRGTSENFSLRRVLPRLR